MNANNNTPTELIYNAIKSALQLYLYSAKSKDYFSILVNELVCYTDYNGDYAFYENGKFIKYDISRCDKTSPFWQALWKLEKDLDNEYALNFNDIWFSFQYNGSIHFTKIKQ